MDMISYGLASKIGKKEYNTRVNVLGSGVEGSHPHAKGRIDNLEKAIQAVFAKADKLIINDTVNIMKANAKLNVISKATRYKHQSMIFEDFLSTAGIDSTKSANYAVDTALGLVKASGSVDYEITSVQDLAAAPPTKAIIAPEEYVQEFKASFNGSNAYGQANHSTSLNPAGSALTIQAEVRFTAFPASTSHIAFINKEVEYEVGINSSGDIGVAITTVNGAWNWVSMATTIPLNQDVNIAITYDGTNIKAYVDGVLKSTKANVTTGDVRQYAYPLRIAARDTNVDGVVDGYVNVQFAKLSLWKSILTEQEITGFVKILPTGSEVGLMAHWNLDAGNGTTIADVSPNGNTMTLTNAVWATIDSNVALNKAVTPIANATTTSINLVTNGVLDTSQYYSGGAGAGSEIQVDLGAAFALDNIHIWHYYADARKYHSVIVKVSEDGTNWSTIFDSNINGAYTETSSGKVHNLGGRKVRYIREAMSGSTANTGNHWVEIRANKVEDTHPIKGEYFISRNDGVNFEKITPEALFYFDDKLSPLDSKIRIKAKLPRNVQLLNYGLTWS